MIQTSQTGKRTEVLQEFLSLYAVSDLSELYKPEMGATVTVLQLDGTRDECSGVVWTDGIYKWYPFVVYDEESAEKRVSYDFCKYVEGIGLTGWNWRSKRSEWVAFDFDSIVNHKQGLDDKKLKQILEELKTIPWVELRKSTSGKGIHAYVYLDPPVKTTGREEHSCLARAILHQLSALCAFDFKDTVDICGGNMWVWHRKVTKENKGLSIIKEGTYLHDVEDSLPEWRDSGIKTQKPMDKVALNRMAVELDPLHQKLIKWLDTNGKAWWWDSDRRMLVTHTLILKQAFAELGFKGVFETNSSGTTQHNCFCFPLRKGGWAVRRYGRGVAEAPNWDTDGSGFTRCYLNVDLSIQQAAKFYSGINRADSFWQFKNFDDMLLALALVGIQLDQPKTAVAGIPMFKELKDARVLIQVTGAERDDPYFSSTFGWYYEAKTWKVAVNLSRTVETGEESYELDDKIRHLVSQAGFNNGWAVAAEGQWIQEELSHVRLALSAMGITGKESAEVLGTSILQPWKLVSIPFSAEYPGGRIWNKVAAQLRHTALHEVPAQLSEACPTWWLVLSHLGKGLDHGIKEDQWARDNGIFCGADYLTAWIASLVQEPLAPLPYLYFYSEREATGKSTFHEALSTIMINGVERADQALLNQNGFNGELEGKVLCVVEESNVAKNKEANTRMKDWVTGTEMAIHRKGVTPYSVTNCSHWVQMSNDPMSCPLSDNDTRICVIKVDPLEHQIPKHLLMERLEEEGKMFTSFVLNFKLPPKIERLNLPAIVSDSKIMMQQVGRSDFKMFTERYMIARSGASVPFKDLYDKYVMDVGADSAENKTSFRRKLGDILVALDSNEELTIANYAWRCDLNEYEGYYVLGNDRRHLRLIK